jgi:hypothetical protein
VSNEVLEAPGLGRGRTPEICPSIGGPEPRRAFARCVTGLDLGAFSAPGSERSDVCANTGVASSATMIVRDATSFTTQVRLILNKLYAQYVLRAMFVPLCPRSDRRSLVYVNMPETLFSLDANVGEKSGVSMHVLTPLVHRGEGARCLGLGGDGVRGAVLVRIQR